MSEPLGAGLEEPRDRHGAFPRLDDDQRARLHAAGEVRAVGSGDVLFREGDAGYDFVVIESAAVAIAQGYGHENRVIAPERRFAGWGRSSSKERPPTNCSEPSRTRSIKHSTPRPSPCGATNPTQTVSVIAAVSGAAFPIGSRWPLDGASVVETVLAIGCPARIDDHSTVSGTIAKVTREFGFPSVVGVPISVEGRVWGLITTATKGPRALPRDTADRSRDFTELIATAVYTLQARDDLRSPADEQAALRRIATLVARGAQPQEVFNAICTETQRLVDATLVNLAEFTSDGFFVALAGSSKSGAHVPRGTRLPIGQDSVSAIVARTGAPAQLDRYDDATGELAVYARERGVRATAAAPILVEGQLWGAVVAGKDSDERFAPGDEERVARFAELAATAISNTTARTGASAAARSSACARESRAPHNRHPLRLEQPPRGRQELPTVVDYQAALKHRADHPANGSTPQCSWHYLRMTRLQGNRIAGWPQRQTGADMRSCQQSRSAGG